MVGLLSWLAGMLATLIGQSAVRFVAWKVVAYALVVTVLPVVLNNFLYSVIDGAINLVDTTTQGQSFNGQLVELTGLAAWLAQQLRIVEGFSIIMSAVMFRVSIRMIPFFRV